jgi:hypothetical protein
MITTRNTPRPLTPHNRLEELVSGLRDDSPTPLTYRKYQRLPNGSEIYIGEFPVPPIKFYFNNRI